MAGFTDFQIFSFLLYFWTENGWKFAWEVFKKLPGERSSVLIEYDPEANHGDLIHDR